MWYIMQSVVVLLLLLHHKSFVVVSSMTTSTVTALGTVSERPMVIHVMVVIPTAGELNGTKALPKWKVGEEILPGALLARKEINNCLSGYQIEIIPVRFPQCDFNTGIVPFVKELTSKRNNIVGIAGYFCHNLAQHLSQLVHHEQTRVVQISATPSQDRDSVPHLQHSILPSTELSARAVALLMQRLGWSRVAVISNQNLNFVNAKRVFIKVGKEHGIKVELEIETSLRSLKEFEIRHELLSFGTKIIIVFVSPSEAVDIFCWAYLNGFNWPDYAWVFMEINEDELMVDFKFCSKNTATIGSVMNNTIFLHLQPKPLQNYQVLPSGLNYSTFYDAYLELLKKSATELNLSLQSNPYANVLYDSIWAFALAVNRSLSTLKARNLSLASISRTKREIIDVLEEQLSEISFQGATSLLNFSQGAASVLTSWTIELFQFQNGQPVQIGTYNASLDQLLLNEGKLGETPSDTLNRIYVLYPIPLTVVFSILIVLCFALTTVSMFLFLYFRREPVIKATSSTLSICMFIGCYLLLTSSLFHTITSSISVQGSEESIRAFICSFDTCLINLGADIVFATVIAKTLRIYHIFKKFGKVNRICSDQGLFVLILAIVSVKIVLWTLWTCLDINHLVDTEQYISQSVPPFILVTEKCDSNYLEIWLLVFSIYTIALMFIMALLAVLTRKIKQGNFKDSKKINILVIALVFNTVISVTLWFILGRSGATILSRLANGMGTLLAAFFCQVFLILPKILPLVLPNCHYQHMAS